MYYKSSLKFLNDPENSLLKATKTGDNQYKVVDYDALSEIEKLLNQLEDSIKN